MKKFYDDEKMENELNKLNNFCICLFGEDNVFYKNKGYEDAIYTIIIKQLDINFWVTLARDGTYLINIYTNKKVIKIDNIEFNSLIQMLKTLEVENL